MAANNLIDRAKSILLTPRSEWPVIAEEPDSVGGLYTRYILVVAAIPAVVHFVSASLIGVSVPVLGYYRVGVGAALSAAIISYVLALIGIFILTLIVNALAPTFGGQKSQVQALKTVAYTYTASCAASIVGLIPGLMLIAALAGGIYGIYLLNMGLPYTMKCPPEKSVGYTAVTIIVAIIVGFVLNLIVASAGGFGSSGMPAGFTTHGAIDNSGFARGSAGAGLQAWSDKMAAASKQVDAAQKSGDADAKANAVGAMLGAALGGSGKVESLAPDRIKPFVPDSLAGMKRTQKRPLPAGRMERSSARDFGFALAGGSVVVMGLAIGVLDAAILALSIFYYAWIYTVWLKPRTPQNIVIGGGAGAFPPMIGWIAVTGHITLMPVLLFLIIFMWTPPHFWALALFVQTDYAKVGIPMMPVVAGERSTRYQILAYAAVLLPLTLVPWWLGLAGVIYGVSALVLGAVFLALSAWVGLRRSSGAEDTMKPEKRLFAYSILYLFVLFAMLVVDHVVATFGA